MTTRWRVSHQPGDLGQYGGSAAGLPPVQNEAVTWQGYLIRCNEFVDHSECPHQFGSGGSFRIGRKPTFALDCPALRL